MIAGGPVNGAGAGLLAGEAHLAARVRDPGVVQIHDVGEANGCLYLVLEYIPGGSLKERLHGPWPAAASAALAEKIAWGMAAVHRARLLHLDLKPSNILLDSDPDTPWESASPKVADFGIVRDADDFGMTRTTLRGPLGTPSYMAPEQVEPDRRAVGLFSDVDAARGDPLRAVNRPPAVSGRVTRRDAGSDPARRCRSPCAGWFRPSRGTSRRILRNLPQKGSEAALPDHGCPRGRPGRWREGRPITARPISIPERAWQWWRCCPQTALRSRAVLAMTLIVGVVSLLVLWRRSESERRRAARLYDVAREL